MVGHYGVFAKIVICAMMIRGRHRGLPYALDRAINLPDDLFPSARRDEEEAEPNIHRLPKKGREFMD